MIKSMFNKPWRTEKEMMADEKKRRSRRSMKNRPASNKFSDLIFQAAQEKINYGITEFTKVEMIELVAGKRKLNIGEWVVWDKACTEAIQKIRRYWWSDDQEVTEKRMFNYTKGKYYLVSIGDDVKTNRVYDSYVQKMKGIMKRTKQIELSGYKDVLITGEGERRAFLEKEEMKELQE